MSVAPIVSNQNRNAQAPSAPAAATSTNPPAPIGQALTGEARIAAEQAGRPIVRHPVSNTIVVNTCQKGNPLLTHIRNVGWEYGDIVPDYQVGATTGVLYLRLANFSYIRYHRLHPEYVHTRVQKLGTAYHLRILLVMCDVEDHQATIREITKMAIINNLTVMVAWSNQEAGRYLELYKSFERKGPDLIKERVDKDYMSQMNAVLTSVRGVNKTDVLTLTTNFGSLKRIMNASADELSSCPGLGEKKVKRLREAFTQPFAVSSSDKRKSQAQKKGEAGSSALN